MYAKHYARKRVPLMNITLYNSRSIIINAKKHNMKFKQNAFVQVYNTSSVERSLENKN